MKLTKLACVLAALGSVTAVTSVADAQSFTVNVKETWCDGKCSEGHDLMECICTFDSTGWTDCDNIPCCEADGSPKYHTISGADVCARTNETGFWSWAAWKSWLFEVDTCNLPEQTPWDDSGTGLTCSDGTTGGGGGGDVWITGGFVEGELYETEGGCWFRQGEWVPYSWCEASCGCWVDGSTCYCYAMMN